MRERQILNPKLYVLLSPPSCTLQYYFNIIVNEQNVFHVLLLIFGTLINQGMNLPKITFPLLLTFGVWSLVTVVITNGYAGLLPSLLCKSTIPFVPKDIAGLLSSPLNFDFGSYRQLQLGELVDSSFLLSGTNYNYITIGRGGNCSVCNQILNKVTFLKPLPKTPDTENVIRTFVAIKNLGQYADRVYNESFKNFVLIEEESFIPFMKEALRLVFNKQKIVVTVGQASPFSVTTFSPTFQSYASKMAQNYFSRMYSSGILSKWKSSQELFLVNHAGVLYNSSRERRKSRYSVLLLPNVYENNDPEKFTVEHFVIPLYILCTLCLILTLCYAFELFFIFVMLLCL